MEEQFVLRVPPSIAQQIERLLLTENNNNNNNASDSDNNNDNNSLDLLFSDDGRNGTFLIGNDCFPASLLDLPTITESYKTYDDNVLIKTADIAQMIVVKEEGGGDLPPDVVESRHGLTPPMRDARKRRFRREPDLNPELVQRVEKDLLNIMNGGTAGNFDMTEQNETGDMKKAAPALAAKHDVSVAGTNVGEPERSDSDDTDSYVDMD